jgi:hypothetical protein
MGTEGGDQESPRDMPAAVTVATAPTSGRRRRRDTRPAPLWVPLVLALMGLLVAAIGAAAVRSELRFGDEGVTAQGQVTNVRRERSTDEDDSDGYDHYVDYRFVDASQVEHRGTSSISADDYRALRPGDPVTVTYLPSDPSEFRLGNPSPRLLLPVLILGVGGLLASVGLLVFVLEFRKRRRTGDRSSPEDPFVVELTAAPTGPLEATFYRRATSILDGTSAEGGGLGTLVINAAIGAVADATRDRDGQPEVLGVDAAGLTIPDVGFLRWSDVAEVRATDGVLRITPRDPNRIQAFRAGGGSPWSRNLTTWTEAGVTTAALELHLALAGVEGSDEAVIDAIARHRIVEIGA